MNKELNAEFRRYDDQRWETEDGKLSTGYQTGVNLEFHGMKPEQALMVLRDSAAGTVCKFAHMTYKRLRYLLWG